MVLNKVNTFLDHAISYKTFFDHNEEYYDTKYRNKRFKLFDNEEGGEGSPYLKITQTMTPPTGPNGQLVRKILIADTDEDVSFTPMKIRRVEVYSANVYPAEEVGRYSNRTRRMINGVFSGGRKASVKKEICGRLRCIYKISGSRKEHVKHKGSLITVADYKKLMKK